MQNLSPFGWALRPLKRYAEFSGRSSRAEFWWFQLALFVFFVVVWFLLFGAMFSSVGAEQTNPSAGMMGAIGVGGMLVGLVWLALLIPIIAAQIRRLHDSNPSGWWLGGFYLLYAIYFALMFGSLGMAMSSAAAGGGASPPQPNGAMFAGTMVLGLGLFIYMIVLLVFYCLPGTKGPNRFGDDPYGANVEEVFA